MNGLMREQREVVMSILTREGIGVRDDDFLIDFCWSFCYAEPAHVLANCHGNGSTIRPFWSELTRHGPGQTGPSGKGALL